MDEWAKGVRACLFVCLDSWRLIAHVSFSICPISFIIGPSSSSISALF